MRYTNFILFYIDDILIFSNTLDEYFKHLNIFKYLVIKNGLVILAPKMKFFQQKIRFLGHNIVNETIILTNSSTEFAAKFLDEITDTKQLQRFLGSLNYVANYYKDLAPYFGYQSYWLSKVLYSVLFSCN